MPTDIEIAQKAKMLRIGGIAKSRLGIDDEHLEPYGHYKAKVSLDYLDSIKDRPLAKLILVTAISPTPAGEGKTTTTVGLGDALNRIGKKTIICLREPSLGPVFGMRGALPAAVMRKWCRWTLSICVLHRRLQRHPARQQPAGGTDRQSHPSRQRPWFRRAADYVETRARHERSRVARYHGCAGWARQWIPAPGRIRHRRRVGSDGAFFVWFTTQSPIWQRTVSVTLSPAIRAIRSRSQRATSTRTAR